MNILLEKVIGTPARLVRKTGWGRSVPRLLIATRHSPLPGTDGAATYLFDIVSYLCAKGIHAKVLWLHADGAITHKGYWRIPTQYRGCASIQILGSFRLGNTLFFPKAIWLPFKAKTLAKIKRGIQLLGGTSLLKHLRPTRRKAEQNHADTMHGHLTAEAWSSLPNQEEIVFFKSTFDSYRPDFLLLNYCWLLPLLQFVHKTPNAVLCNDVVSQRLKPSTASNPDPATPDGEQALLGLAETILAISAQDGEIFKSWLPNSKVILVPKAAYIQSRVHVCRKNRIIFVGADNAFNIEGIRWFIYDVLPLVWALNPEAELHVFGSVSKSISDISSERIVPHGRVEDLAQEYSKALLTIVPLKHGSGVKIKLVEAAAHGTPIVSTSVGMQGLSFLTGHVSVANTPEDFAEAICELLDDEEAAFQKGLALQKKVAHTLSPDAAYGELYTHVMAPFPKHGNPS